MFTLFRKKVSVPISGRRVATERRLARGRHRNTPPRASVLRGGVGQADEEAAVEVGQRVGLVRGGGSGEDRPGTAGPHGPGQGDRPGKSSH